MSPAAGGSSESAHAAEGFAGSSATELPSNPYNPHAWIIGEPEIGAGTWIGAFTVIDGSGGLTIGAGCDISCGAQIYTHSSVRRCVSGRRFTDVEREPTRIGDRVFVGAGAVINMGVSIGDECVIAAGSVVTKDVPPRTVVAGVPARPIAQVEIADRPEATETVTAVDVTFRARPVESGA